MNKMKQIGQGMTEYIIIVALIAIAGIAAWSFFGQSMQAGVADIGSELSGASANQDGAGAIKAAADAEAASNEQMGNYDDNAGADES